MLIELSIGDAYGSGFEYSPERFINDCLKYIISLGGDVDTAAAIAFGRDYIVNLNRCLMALTKA